jgi:hypothetical protein
MLNAATGRKRERQKENVKNRTLENHEGCATRSYVRALIWNGEITEFSSAPAAHITENVPSVPGFLPKTNSSLS